MWGRKEALGTLHQAKRVDLYGLLLGMSIFNA